MTQSPFAAELDAQRDDAMIKLLYGQISRKGYGRNKDRAYLKDLIADRDSQGRSEDDRRELAQTIITKSDQLIQANQRQEMEDRRADELARGNVMVQHAEQPDSTGRRWIKTTWSDGYSETQIFENDEEWAEHLTNEIRDTADLENQKRDLKLQKVPEELRPFVKDVDALFEHMREQREGESSPQKAERIAGELKLLRPAMTKAAYARLSDLASGRSDVQTTTVHDEGS